MLFPCTLYTAHLCCFHALSIMQLYFCLYVVLVYSSRHTCIVPWLFVFLQCHFSSMSHLFVVNERGCVILVLAVRVMWNLQDSGFYGVLRGSDIDRSSTGWQHGRTYGTPMLQLKYNFLPGLSFSVFITYSTAQAYSFEHTLLHKATIRHCHADLL